MRSSRVYRGDVAHHHPRVRRSGTGGWVWACDCGSASCRTAMTVSTWRQAVLGALNHASCLAP
jgi:hypothetical protein